MSFKLVSYLKFKSDLLKKIKLQSYLLANFQFKRKRKGYYQSHNFQFLNKKLISNEEKYSRNQKNI